MELENIFSLVSSPMKTHCFNHSTQETFFIILLPVHKNDYNLPPSDYWTDNKE